MPIVACRLSRRKGFYGSAAWRKQRIKNAPKIPGKSINGPKRSGAWVVRRKQTWLLDWRIMHMFPKCRSNQNDITTHYLKLISQFPWKNIMVLSSRWTAKKNSYDESLMRQIFTTGEKYRNLYCQKSDEKMIREAIAELIEPGRGKERITDIKKCWMCCNRSHKKGYLFENKILPLLPNVTESGNRCQNQVAGISKT